MGVGGGGGGTHFSFQTIMYCGDVSPKKVGVVVETVLLAAVAKFAALVEYPTRR
jgi:hypothetical protein